MTEIKFGSASAKIETKESIHNMACQGPDLNEARKFGKRVGEALFEELLKEYNIGTSPFILPNADKRWKKVKQSFIKSVEEIFVEDECNFF